MSHCRRDRPRSAVGRARESQALRAWTTALCSKRAPLHFIDHLSPVPRNDPIYVSMRTATFVHHQLHQLEVDQGLSWHRTPHRRVGRLLGPRTVDTQQGS